MASSALSRFRVLDLTRVRAGPTCVRQFADFGAQVIKVEVAPRAMPGWAAHDWGPDFQNLHRNKRSITLDLKAPEGLDILRKLVGLRSDVMVENFRPGREGQARHRLRGDARDQSRGWSTPASPASAKMARTARGPASTRSPRAWAG